MYRRLHDQGFSLLELVVVVLIIALVMAVSYPSISRGTNSIHMRTTARDILNTFRYAREKAVTEQMGMQVAVSREKQQLVLSTELGEGTRTYVLPRNVKIQRMSLAGTEIESGLLIVRFLPNGSAENAGLWLKSDNGTELRIVTDPITGGARVVSGDIAQ